MLGRCDRKMETRCVKQKDCNTAGENLNRELKESRIMNAEHTEKI